MKNCLITTEEAPSSLVINKSEELTVAQFNLDSIPYKLFLLCCGYANQASICTIPINQPLEFTFSNELLKQVFNRKPADFYNPLKQACKKLNDLTIYIQNEKDSEFIFVKPFPFCSYERGTLTIRMEQILTPHILSISTTLPHRNPYAFRNIMQISNKYALRMYEICNLYLAKGITTFEVSSSELRERLGITNKILEIDEKDHTQIIKEVTRYPVEALFRISVLDKVQKELANTNISFDYKFKKPKRDSDGEIIYTFILFTEGNTSVPKEKTIQEQLQILQEISFLPFNIDQLSSLAKMVNWDIDLILKTYDFFIQQQKNTIVFEEFKLVLESFSYLKNN